MSMWFRLVAQELHFGILYNSKTIWKFFVFIYSHSDVNGMIIKGNSFRTATFVNLVYISVKGLTFLKLLSVRLNIL